MEEKEKNAVKRGRRRKGNKGYFNNRRKARRHRYKPITVKYKKLDPEAIAPEYKTSGSAGFDFYAIEDGVVNPGERVVVRTGLAFEIPKGFVMKLYPRSGNAKDYGITLVNAVGIIDSDYRGEVMGLLYNTGKEPFVFKKGDRIMQGEIERSLKAQFVEVDELSKTDRGEGGFGSTGRN